MALHNNLGNTGEEIACRYLEERGHTILDRNWRLGHFEVDIITLKDDLICFVEVKTRKSNKRGEPEEAVDYDKREAYIACANAYVRSKRRYEEVRFDIIGIVASGDNYEIHYLENAFSTVREKRRKRHEVGQVR